MALVAAPLNPNVTLPSGGLEGATDNVISAVYWNRAMSLLFYLTGTAGYIGCRAASSGVQSISNATDTQMNMATESFESDPNGAMHPTGVGNAYITIQTPGVYLITAFAQFASNATGYRRLQLRYNVFSTNAIIGIDTRAAASGVTTDITTTTAFLMAAADTIDLLATQTSGGALDCTVTCSVVKL